MRILNQYSFLFAIPAIFDIGCAALPILKQESINYYYNDTIATIDQQITKVNEIPILEDVSTDTSYTFNQYIDKNTFEQLQKNLNEIETPKPNEYFLHCVLPRQFTSDICATFLRSNITIEFPDTYEALLRYEMLLLRNNTYLNIIETNDPDEQNNIVKTHQETVITAKQKELTDTMVLKTSYKKAIIDWLTNAKARALDRKQAFEAQLNQDKNQPPQEKKSSNINSGPNPQKPTSFTWLLKYLAIGLGMIAILGINYHAFTWFTNKFSHYLHIT